MRGCPTQNEASCIPTPAFALLVARFVQAPLRLPGKWPQCPSARAGSTCARHDPVSAGSVWQRSAKTQDKEMEVRKGGTEQEFGAKSRHAGLELLAQSPDNTQQRPCPSILLGILRKRSRVHSIAESRFPFQRSRNKPSTTSAGYVPLSYLFGVRHPQTCTSEHGGLKPWRSTKAVQKHAMLSFLLVGEPACASSEIDANTWRSLSN